MPHLVRLSSTSFNAAFAPVEQRLVHAHACRYVDVRNMACFVLEQLLALVGPKLSHDARRAIYPELLKRLDDSSDQVPTHWRACVCVRACVRAYLPARRSKYAPSGAMDDSGKQVPMCLRVQALACAPLKPCPFKSCE